MYNKRNWQSFKVVMILNRTKSIIIISRYSVFNKFRMGIETFFEYCGNFDRIRKTVKFVIQKINNKFNNLHLES